MKAETGLFGKSRGMLGMGQEVLAGERMYVYMKCLS